MIDDDDAHAPSLQELFRREANGQAQVLTDGLLALERGQAGPRTIDDVMRAAHSLKGAARVVALDPVERIAHKMEDCFVAARNGTLTLGREEIDQLLAAVDMITDLASLQEHRVEHWMRDNGVRLEQVLNALSGVAAGRQPLTPAAGAAGFSEFSQRRPPPRASESDHDTTAADTALAAGLPAAQARDVPDDQALRIDVRRFDRLVALASETAVSTNTLAPQLQALQGLRRKQQEAVQILDRMRAARTTGRREWQAMRERLLAVAQALGERSLALEDYEGRQLLLSRQLLDEVLALRMRPLREGTTGLARMVRDLAHQLGKDVHFEVEGAGTMVDREVMARMEAPLQQLLRNALDHGIETASERLGVGKPARGLLRLAARHRAGLLHIEVRDDGRGIDPQAIRSMVVARGLADETLAATMSETELLDFLLLPGFSMREQAGPISGRGIGLDVVADAVRRLNGNLRVETRPGQGFATLITLPLSQSLLRALVVRAGGELLALPAAGVNRVMRIARSEVRSVGPRQYVSLEQSQVDLIPLAPLLDLDSTPAGAGESLEVVLIGDANQCHGLVVDELVCEQQLVVQALEPALGKVRDVSAAAMLKGGEPVLILDLADLLQGIRKRAAEGSLQRVNDDPGESPRTAKRVLVVDDSLTVREMQRKLLQTRGYDVELAVDGMDGWNAVRSGRFDLVITDVDMPRVDGIELVSLIKNDDRLRNLPVMIVSYKDRPEDRTRGIDAGADYYLAKGTFHDTTLLDAVADLIGDSGR